jgi:hypothetical protein
MSFLAATGLLGGAGAAAGGGITASGLLSGVATVGGVLGALAAGAAQSESYKAQAFTSDMEAENEAAQSFQRTTAMKRELARILGENDVNYAAAGIDISGGVAADARSAAERRAAQEISIDRSMSDAKRGMLRAQAASYRRLAAQARTAGLFNAIAAL